MKKLWCVKLVFGVLAALMMTTPSVYAGRKKKKQPAAPPTPLTDTGKALMERYSGILAEAKAQINQAVPTIDPAKKKAYLNTIEAEKTALAELAEVQKGFGDIKKGHGLVGHAKGKWIGGAMKGIADTEAKLKNAKTAAEREELNKKLEGWRKNLADGEKALIERQAFLDKALAKEPELKKAKEAAEKKLADAKATVLQAVKELGLADLLASDALDATLVKFMVLSEATPRGLAAYAQQGAAQEQLIEKLLGDTSLMKQMMIADGATGGKYGKAMEIYTTIQSKSAKAQEGVLQRLALAISLEHAVPLNQRSAKAKTDAPTTVDPVKRYLAYEKAYLNNELDPGFKTLDTWDYRLVVDGAEPDETAAWGREMLRTYRPDHISTKNYGWRYVAAVKTDIRYGSQYNKLDKPELQFFQNILANGGVCGRRAFFGRFILRAFGIPTTARPQRGHAALVHWTPKGWVACLGGGWGSGWTKGRYNKDLDFLANTQARENRKDYLKVKRAQWIGSTVGEKPVYGLVSGEPGFWYGVSLFVQRKIIEDAKAEALAAVGEDLGEANESKVKEKILDTKISEAHRKVSIGANGVITVPAAACSKPKNNTRKIKFMPSHGSGMQLHYERTGGAETFEYTIDAPASGAYALTATLATPTPNQLLLVSVNGAKDPVEIAMPYTLGLWGKTSPVTITLKAGKNVLTFSRAGDNIRGLSVKEFVLKPVK